MRGFELLVRLQTYLVSDPDAWRPKLCHYQPQLDRSAGARLRANRRFNRGAPLAGGTAHRRVRLTWVEGIRLIFEIARLAEKEVALAGRKLERDAVVEYSTGWNVGAARRIRPVHGCAAG